MTKHENKLIRGEKWNKIMKLAEIDLTIKNKKTIEWMKNQKAIMDDIDYYLKSKEEPKEIIDYSKMNVEQLKAALDEAGIDYESNALKADLILLTEEI